jgi:glycosyltransferase involved in cell wall biosynthesis
LVSGNDSNAIISVVIPTLNEEKLILQTLQQFTPELKKKYNIEVIVSDGGSTDATISLAEGTADFILKKSDDEKQNISKGRNIGAINSRGSYVYFFNADTRIENISYFFERTFALMQKQKITALTMKFGVFPEEKRFSDSLFHTFYNTYVYVLNLIGMGMGRGECHIIKKEVFEKVNGYNEKLAAGEDFDLYRRIRKYGKVKYVRDLKVYESPRRYRKYGYAKVFMDWSKNAISVILKNRSVSDVWDPVR